MLLWPGQEKALYTPPAIPNVEPGTRERTEPADPTSGDYRLGF